uniref:beta-defensin 125 n=1 Tax=Jaculus jaculus TaxID=51337 RepID=UPI000332FEA4|nr:beta-defensin 125 [Jaculus jaculus]
MTLPTLTFIFCGLLTQMTEAGLVQRRCWDNNVGYCRVRCLDNERYILLCENKKSCCITDTYSKVHSHQPGSPGVPVVSGSPGSTFQETPGSTIPPTTEGSKTPIP